MKLAIVGGRDFCDQVLFDEAMKNFNPKEIISGGATGADSMAVEFAVKNGVKLTVFQPDWKTHGRVAGPIRNKLIIESADALLAFWDGKSKGTKNSIDLAKKKGIPTNVEYY